jgi:putative hydrolase of the HAD superfamily
VSPGTEALLLDALGTLVTLEPPAPLLVAELAERCGVRVSTAQAARALAAEIGYYRAHMGEGRDHAALLELRGRCAEVLRAALPPSRALDAVGGERLTNTLLASLRFRAYPDAAPALASARARGLRVAVASNWDISLHGVLGRLGMAEDLDAIVTSAEAGAGKPDPAVFRAALARIGCPAEAALHVGDGVVEDIEGARSAGVRAVLIARDGTAGPPGVRTIASLIELADVI